MKKNCMLQLCSLFSLLKRRFSCSCFVLLLICLSTTWASGGEADPEKRLSLKVDGVSAFDVVQRVASKTGIKFIYQIDALRAIKGISFNVKDVTVGEILTQALKGSNQVWEMQGDVYVIKRKVVESSKATLKKFKGIVRDEKDQPMVGVTVFCAKTGLGTTTNLQGQFSIEVPDSSLLNISFIGYKTDYIQTVGDKVMLIKLLPDQMSIDEVQVVAYGEQSKREVTGAIERVTAEQLKEVPSASVSNLLQGKVSGLSVINTSGSPGGGGSTVTIRGFNSLSIEGERRLSDPLWVIDGIPVPNFTSPVTGTNGLADLDPNMIESIEVLKDAASAAIYGSRAANGVILVTTKKGKVGRASLSANYSQTWSFNPITPPITGGAEERRFRLLQLKNFVKGYRVTNSNGSYSYRNPTSFNDVYGTANSGHYDVLWNKGYGADLPTVQDSLNSFYNNSTNWFKEFLRVGKVQNANIQASGGSNNVSYHVGLGYYKESGVLVGSDFNRINLSGNYTMRPVPGAVIDSRVYLAYTDRSKSRQSYPGMELMDINPYKLSTLLPLTNGPVFESAMANLNGIKEKNYDYKIRANNTLAYNILPDLKLSVSIGVDYWQNMMDYFRPSYLASENPNRPKESLVSGTVGRYLMLLNENLITYNLKWREHKLDVLLGQSSQLDESNRSMGMATGGPSDFIHYATPGFPEIGYQDDGVTPRQMQSFQSSMEKKALMSWFGRLNYVFNGKYLASITYRRDGSSTFGEKNKWGTFPSASVGWLFSEEWFVKEWKPLYSGKIRASIGKSGLHFSQPYLAYGLMVPNAYNFLAQAGLNPEWKEGAPNPSLRWEETTQYDVGLDLDFFNRRLSITMDYYLRVTDGMLAPVSLPGSGSYNPYQRQWQNACSLSNSGLELKVEADFVRNDDFVWEFSFNIARNWNKFRNSAGRRDFASSGSNLNIVGKPMNQLYVYKYMGIYQSDDDVPVYNYVKDRYNYTLSGGVEDIIYRAGDPIYLDVNQDGKISSADKVNAGSPLPEATGGFTNSIRWKNFDLNCLFAFTLGRTILNSSLGRSFQLNVTNPDDGIHALHPILADLRDYTFWSSGVTGATMPMIQADPGRAVFSNATTRDVKRIHFMKLKTMVLGYTLKKPFPASNLGFRFYVSGENLWTLTNYKGRDPETIDLVTGIDAAEAYPLATRLTVGLTVNF